MSGAETIQKRDEFLPASFRQGVCCTYLLKCADGSLYCGWTNDLEHRLKAHNQGTGGKYTRSRRPVTLVYTERFATREQAMRREWEIKQMSRAEKLRMILRAEQGEKLSESNRTGKEKLPEENNGSGAENR